MRFAFYWLNLGFGGRLVALVLISLLVSCRPTAVPPTPATIVTMATSAVGTERTVLETQIATFAAQNPTIEVHLVDVPESSAERYYIYKSWLGRQDPTVDIFMLDLIWAPEFGANNWITPLDRYVTAANLDMRQFLPAMVQASTWNGQLVAMPWFADVGLLYYRQDLLNAYGFLPPRTWDDLVETAAIVTRSERFQNPVFTGLVYQSASYEGVTVNYLEQVWSYGGDILDESGTRVVLNSPEAVLALEDFAALQQIAPPGIRYFAEEDALNYFASGNALFMRNWPYAWAVLNAAGSPLQGQIGLAPLPQGRSGVSVNTGALGGRQLAINRYSEQPEEAFALIAFLTSTEQQNYRAIHAGQNPTRLVSYQNTAVLQNNPHLSPLYDVIFKAHARPIHPAYAQISAIIQQQVGRTLRGEQDAPTSTANMAEAIQAIINQTQPTAEVNP